MKNTLVFLLTLSICQSAFPVTRKLSMTSDFPLLYDKTGQVNPKFFKVLSKVTAGLNGTCSDYDTDPRRKALMYIGNMKNFAGAMEKKIILEAMGMLDGDQQQVNEQFDEKIGKIEADLEEATSMTNYLLMDAHDGVGWFAMSVYPLRVTKIALELVSASVKLRDQFTKKDPLPVIGSHQLKSDSILHQVNALTEHFTDLKVQLENIENAMVTGKESFIKTKAEQELMRFIICSFSYQGQAEDFCSGAGGPKRNMSDQRANYTHTGFGQDQLLTCEDIETFGQENKWRAVRHLLGSLAYRLARTVKFKDQLGIMNDGTTARFEVSYIDRKKSIKFNGPGGNRLLCSILKDAQFDAFWRKDDGQKIGSKVSIMDLGLPISFYEPNDKFSQFDVRFQISGNRRELRIWDPDLRRMKITPYKSHHPRLYKQEFWNVPVNTLVESCER